MAETPKRPSSSYRGARRNAWRKLYKQHREQAVKARVPHVRWGMFWRRPLIFKLNALVHPSLS